MVGGQKDFVGLHTNYLLLSFGQPLNMKLCHCLVHQVALYATSAHITQDMTVVFRTMHPVFICALNHRQSCRLSEDAEVQFGDLIYFSKVCCLSRGKKLKGVFNLTNELEFFMWKMGNPIPYFENSVWVCDF